MIREIYKKGVDQVDNEIDVKKKHGKMSAADKIVIAIITVLFSVILLCIIFLFVDFSPRNKEVENAAVRYTKAYVDFDYDTYNELVFIDEEAYYTLLYSKYAESRNLTLEEYINKVNETDYFPFTFQSMDELAFKLFQSNKEDSLNKFGNWESKVVFDKMIVYSNEQLECLKNKIKDSYTRTDNDYLSGIGGINISQIADIDKITAAYEMVLDIEMTFSDIDKSGKSNYRVVVVEYDSQYKVIDNTDYCVSHFDTNQLSKEVFSNIVFTDTLLRNIAIRCTISLVLVIVVVLVGKAKKAKKGREDLEDSGISKT